MSDLRRELARARATVVRAELTDRPAERYLTALLAVGQVAAVIIGARLDRAKPQRRNLWQVVVEIAPELGEWAAYFHALQGKRDAVRAGAISLVTSREADDLVRDAHAFADLVEQRLGVAACRRAG
ncbi:SAV_6107 family HEPN domain-containing protein [Granulicoccus sp. GXG6511]|uniref:SAV_6107 family HEPN domain-containing protein n=1 Tax=Granulicoccus sp. GXG6511 TaxID=3381351 RepID=UPI003D7D7B77